LAGEQRGQRSVHVLEAPAERACQAVLGFGTEVELLDDAGFKRSVVVATARGRDGNDRLAQRVRRD
jgi:hypothetical protein